MSRLLWNMHFRELKAKSLPSIALAGELMYESLIPGQEELIDEITERWLCLNSQEKKSTDS